MKAGYGAVKKKIRQNILHPTHDLSWPAVWGTWLILDQFLQCGSWLVETAGHDHQVRPVAVSHKPQGTIPPCSKLLWRSLVYYLCLRHPFLEECRHGLRHFWALQACLGDGFAPEPPKSWPCAILAWFSGAYNKYLSAFCNISQAQFISFGIFLQPRIYKYHLFQLEGLYQITKSYFLVYISD